MSDDLFDDARSSFITKEDLTGCLIAYLATEKSEERQGDNGPYKLSKGVCLVLDGKPSESFTEQYGDKLPVFMDEFGISGATIEPQVAKSFRTGKPVLGRMTPFKNSKRTTSYKLDDPTDADKALARKHADAIRKMMDESGLFSD